MTLGDGPLTLADADGSAIIIHGNPDQGITGEPKSGVSGGPRVACGVITVKYSPTRPRSQQPREQAGLLRPASSPVAPFNTSTRGANGRA